MDNTPRPQLRPTNAATLFVAALAAAAASWMLIGRFYNDVPPMPWLPAFTLALLAVAEVAMAINTKARIDRKPGAGLLEPLLVARFAVLAKASALTGAIFGGVYLGIGVWLAAAFAAKTHARADLPPTIGGILASAGLVAAALWLERACRVPERGPDDSEDDDSEEDAENTDQPR